ncbi:MAG TPA: hypothetical protein VNG51_16255 [Ktedonobacteraceae bacterium]|nr:hypothetical protein [Ktedonobacteraceae bacterium]
MIVTSSGGAVTERALRARSSSQLRCQCTRCGTGHTCGGSSPNGAAMTYDAAGRLATWTAPSGATASDSFLYDNAGNRVLQTTSNTSNGTTTTTDTITFDGYTETSITNGTTTTIKYYSLNGQKVAMHWNGVLYYLLSDSLGSSTVALKYDGTTQAAQLFAPTVQYVTRPARCPPRTISPGSALTAKRVCSIITSATTIR